MSTMFSMCKPDYPSKISSHATSIAVVSIPVAGSGRGNLFSETPEVVAVSVASVTFEGPFVAAITISVTGALCTVKCNVTACKSFVAEISGSVMATRLDKIGISMEN